ncbi:MAG: nuclear transport factor 2 family protein [bacterium]|nr:MAG: nuclear transport factor 2 family protein [bacterium]
MRSFTLALFSFAAAALFLLTGVLPAAADGPAESVAAFHRALSAGDRESALDLLAPNLILFEDGHAELSRDEYGSGHLDADLKFSQKSKRDLVAQQANAMDDTAWVMSRYETKGKLSGKRVTVATTETMVLRNTDAGWRIVHIHWSNSVQK